MISTRLLPIAASEGHVHLYLFSHIPPNAGHLHILSRPGLEKYRLGVAWGVGVAITYGQGMSLAAGIDT